MIFFFRNFVFPKHSTKDNISIMQIEGYFCRKTYLGLLLGEPNKEVDKLEVKWFESFVRNMNYLDSKHYIHSIIPKVIEYPGEKIVRLPSYACSISLASSTTG